MGMESIIPGTTRKWEEPVSPVRTAAIKVTDRCMYEPNYDAIHQTGIESATIKTGPMVKAQNNHQKD